ncbi:MAG: formimidoylglutamase [Bdellovibrionaceae bacterium]|nr:formimidoylglutamase [Pseudobdellovibrionaceae bacterium]
MKKSLSVFSYPDDEGIKINGGRLGAHLAPAVICQLLQKSKKDFWPSNISLVDEGSLNIKDLSLENKHDAAIKKASSLVKNHDYNIFLGGGHDYAYPDGIAFLKYCKQQEPSTHKPLHKPLIINIDAHLDVRPTDKGFNSGTPFYRLLSKHHSEFSFWEIGIQKPCNTQEHWQWCLAHKGNIISNDELLLHSPSWAKYVINKLPLDADKKQPVYLSIDIDAFSSSYAMGCSQSWPLGILPHEFFVFLHLLMQNSHVKVMGIYEVSPPLDQDNRTSKLALQIIHHYAQGLTQ